MSVEMGERAVMKARRKTMRSMKRVLVGVEGDGQKKMGHGHAVPLRDKKLQHYPYLPNKGML
jgi:hypothetical protein